MNLITIKTFDNSIDAHLTKIKLESEGIECFLFDENIMDINPLYNLTVGGVKLKVRDVHVDKAIEMIRLTEQIPLTDEEGEIIICPKCQSSDIDHGFKSMSSLEGVFFGLLAFLLMIFPLFYKTIKKCRSCDFEFPSQEK
ncbi:MAG: putative signal transducing protein [Flavobacteriales bacterium]